MTTGARACASGSLKKLWTSLVVCLFVAFRSNVFQHTFAVFAHFEETLPARVILGAPRHSPSKIEPAGLCGCEPSYPAETNLE